MKGILKRIVLVLLVVPVIFFLPIYWIATGEDCSGRMVDWMRDWLK